MPLKILLPICRERSMPPTTPPSRSIILPCTHTGSRTLPVASLGNTRSVLPCTHTGQRTLPVTLPSNARKVLHKYYWVSPTTHIRSRMLTSTLQSKTRIQTHAWGRFVSSLGFQEIFWIRSTLSRWLMSSENASSAGRQQDQADMKCADS